MTKSAGLVIAVLMLAGCRAVQQPPLPTVAHVDLQRFMGDWYVIASIPTRIEVGAHNAVESYQLSADGTIATTFAFRAGAFDGKQKRYTPRGYVFDRGSNAVWGMQFIWPIKADYRIVYLDPAYSQTVIARTARDYVWIMARTPRIPEPDYRQLLGFVAGLGYHISRIERVPQSW